MRVKCVKQAPRVPFEPAGTRPVSQRGWLSSDGKVNLTPSLWCFSEPRDFEDGLRLEAAAERTLPAVSCKPVIPLLGDGTTRCYFLRS